MMVVYGLSSLRGAAMNFGLFRDVLKDGLPCWTVIQNWILRFGLYKLQQPLSRRNDWVLVVDHTIEFGAKNCLVVLATSLETFRKRDCQLRHQDMQVAAIKVGGCSTGAEIAEVLKELGGSMGVPAQIVSDDARNIKAGIRKFNECLVAESSETTPIRTYDVTHKAALLLKYLLKDDAQWKGFNTRIAETKRKVVHTKYAAYAPNKPRDKSRWLNLDAHITWAEAILNRKGKHGHPTKEDREWSEGFNALYGWVAQYKRQITQWRLWLDVLDVAKCEVKKNGLREDTAKDFRKRVAKIRSKRTSVRKLKNELVHFFQEETRHFQGEEPWLGTSDIIESVFGKYKVFSAKTPMKEVGKAILTIPVLTSAITPGEVRNAMETVSDKVLQKWIRDNLGESLFAKRKKAFSPQKQKTE
jgi:hypothetical protein